MASQIKSVHYGVVECNVILLIIGLGGIEKDYAGVVMVGVQYVLVTDELSDG